MQSAVGLGLFKGNGDGHLYPDNPITRQETFVVVGRYLKLEEENGATAFSDDDSIADWAKGLIKALRSNGYISGDDKGNVNPNNKITRVEFAQLVYNMYNKLAEADVNENNTDKDASGKDKDSSSTGKKDDPAEVFGKLVTGSSTKRKGTGTSSDTQDTSDGSQASTTETYQDGDDVVAEDIFD
jgi:hypothetical protein